MGDPRRASRAAGDAAELRSAELEELAPYLELAREIKREVDRIAADDSADLEQVSEAIAQIPRAERQRVSEAVFQRLPPDGQWAVLERVFGDEELRQHLAHERQRVLESTERLGVLQTIVEAARRSRSLDLRHVPEGEEVVLGLFREADVRTAVARGHVCDNCARELVLRCTAPPELRVIEDVFNPRGGLFVARAYDEDTWAADRFASHASVVVGAAQDGPHGTGLDPVLYPGARADFQTDSGVIRGRLHLGFVMLGDIDVFAE